MFFVYVLVSEIKGLRFYVGMSENPEKRVNEHNSGKTQSTKSYIPWTIFYFEKYPTRKDAREREKYLKSGSGKEKIKKKWLESKSNFGSAGYLPADA